jgi:hypothetical protein
MSQLFWRGGGGEGGRKMERRGRKRDHLKMKKVKPVGERIWKGRTEKGEGKGKKGKRKVGRVYFEDLKTGIETAEGSI